MSRRGQKTHGRWLDHTDGRNRRVVSGDDEQSTRVQQLLGEMGCRRQLFASTHVEMKVATAMRDQGIRDATLVLNYDPCRGPLSCRALLPAVLPSGSTLTVHAPNNRYTFEGGKESPWRQ